MSLSASPALRASQGHVSLTIAECFRAHAALIAIITVFVLAAVSAQHYHFGDQAKDLVLYSDIMLLLAGLFVFCFLAGHTLYIMIFVRPDRLTAHIWHDLRSRFLTTGRLTQASIILVLLCPFMSALTLFKTLIPFIQPFYLDDLFMKMDRFLHGGVDPWTLLQPLIGFPFATFTINVVYNLWFFVFFSITFWQAFSGNNPQLRQQYFLTFVLLWSVLGVVCATAFSAAGPVYYGRITGLDDPYEPLMEYLRAANDAYPIWALNTQEYLWKAYENRSLTVGGGISAMPSLHVAIAVLFALLGWKTNRWLGGSCTLFAAIILVGSVHLGWHYAVDGYVSIALTCLIWWAVGKWVDRSWLKGQFAGAGRLRIE